MTGFTELDTSAESSQPIELYEFTIGKGLTTEYTHRLTSHDDDVTFNGYVYTAAYIERSDLVIDGDESADRKLEITVSYDSIIGAQFLYGQPKHTVSVRLLRAQRAASDTVYLTLWTGLVANHQKSYPEITLSCAPLNAVFIGTCAHSRYSKGRCRHVLGNPTTCKATPVIGVSKGLWQGGSLFAVMDATLGGQPASYFSYGVLTFDGQQLNVKSIAAHPTLAGYQLVTTVLPLSSQGNVPNAVEHGVIVQTPLYAVSLGPTCNLLYTTCDTKFNNAANYGGFDDLPTDSGPFAGVPIIQ